MKKEKFLLDIQTKCGDISNEILYATIDAERTFKCKWPKPLEDIEYLKSSRHLQTCKTVNLKACKTAYSTKTLSKIHYSKNKILKVGVI